MGGMGKDLMESGRAVLIVINGMTYNMKIGGKLFNKLFGAQLTCQADKDEEICHHQPSSPVQPAASKSPKHCPQLLWRLQGRWQWR